MKIETCQVLRNRPKMDYRGHDIEYRHFKTERHSGLAPHHFKPQRPSATPFLLLLICAMLGAFALTLFLIQMLR